LASVTRADLVAFHDMLLRPDRTVYAVVGDIAVDEVLTLFHRTAPSALFAAEALPLSTTPTMPMRSDISTQVLTTEGKQTHIIWGFPTVTMYNRDRYALRILDTILGGMGGRLFTELRDQKSLAYTVTSFDAYPVDRGFFPFYFGAGQDREAKALREFDGVVRGV